MLQILFFFKFTLESDCKIVYFTQKVFTIQWQKLKLRCVNSYV